MHCCSKNSIVNLSTILIVLISFVKAEETDSTANKPPALLTIPLIPVSIDLLKNGLWGSCTAEVNIDSMGVAQSCVISPSDNKAFDSLVYSKVLSARFSPAIEDGKAVSSTVNFQIAVPYDSLSAQCLSLAPSIRGSVDDTLLKISLPKTRVALHYTDTTEDSSLRNRFEKYLTNISKLTNVVYDGNSLITETDSLGRFVFRLLPQGRFILSIQSPGYEKRQFCGRITNEPSDNHYILRSLEELPRDKTNEITVFGRSKINDEKIEIAEEEKHTGFSPFLSNVIQAKAEIRRVPEGPSKMLVRSGSPFDNMYVIAGIPMLAPFHFGGHPYADIDGLMISSLKDVNVKINDIAAKRVDVSGCIIEADPGKIRSGKDTTDKGLYLKGDCSYLGLDLMASYTFKNDSTDFIQAGYSVSDNYSFKWNNKFYKTTKYGNYGIGIPLTYGNATLLGSKSIKKLRCVAFGWFAWDTYNVLKEADMAKQQIRDELVGSGDYGEKMFPWGMGSVKITHDSSHRSITIGAARQFFGNGKQVVKKVYTTNSYLNNGELTVNLDTILRKPFVAKLSARVSYNDWYGYLKEQSNDTIRTVRNCKGKEAAVFLNSSMIKQSGKITTEINVLPSIINYNGPFQFLADGAISANYEADNVKVGVYGGTVTSRPDIRGLPDSLFRRSLNRTLIASLPVIFRHKIFNRIGIQPYVRYCTNAPQIDLIRQVWTQDASTALQAYGADLDFRVAPRYWMEISSALNISETKRKNNTDNNLPYEWSLPWTIRSSLHLSSRNDRVQFYVDYIHTKGLPYYDAVTKKYQPLPVYRSMDINLQFCNPIEKVKFINQLDCYLVVKNVQDLIKTSNVRDYYWDMYGDRQPVRMGYGRIDIGARFGIRMFQKS